MQSVYDRYHNLHGNSCFTRSTTSFQSIRASDGANHFSSAEYVPGWAVTFTEDGKVVPRPGNGTVFDADLYTDKLLSYLNQSRSDGKPFFAYLATQVAHTPFQAPRDDIEKYYNMYKSMGWDKARELRFERNRNNAFKYESTYTTPASTSTMEHSFH